MILLSDAIDRIPEDNRDNYLFPEISSQFRTEAFQYFGGEILASLPRATRRFLIVSSVFETIDPALMGDLYKEVNCREILAKLVQRNLFVHSIHDERDGWLFRYHQLFRDYLLSLFNSNFDEDERSAILYQAGLLCESHGKMEYAAHFYIRCGRYQNAVNVIETIGTDLLKMGRTNDLSTLIQALPENQIKNNPWLLLYLSATRRFTEADENTHSLQTALELFKQRQDVRGRILTFAFLIESSTYRGRDITPIGILLEEAETLLHASPIESYPWESAILWHQVGFGLALRAGDQRKSYQACQNAYLLSRTIGTHISWNKILMGLVCFHQKKTAKAAILPNEALDHFTGLASTLTLVIVHWALAFVRHDQKKHDQAVHHLKTGIDIARKNAFYHLFFMNQEDIFKVGLLCVEYDLKETESYVSKFLALRLAGSAIDKLLRYIDQSKTKSTLAYNFVEYIHRFSLPMIRVEALNGFRVYRDGYRIRDDEWGGSLPQSLLKAIITRGCRQVPKERVMEDLWPGATRSSSETNFKVNLHRLRKLMEPSMLKELGSSYIRLKGNLITLDEELCEIDVVQFSELRTRASAAKSQGHTKTAIECLAEAVRLYKNDYLAEDLYNDAIGLERDKLRGQYADCLFELAALYEMKGSLKKAEDLYKKLRTELDADPDDVTRSIYENILDKNRTIPFPSRPSSIVPCASHRICLAEPMRDLLNKSCLESIWTRTMSIPLGACF